MKIIFKTTLILSYLCAQEWVQNFEDTNFGNQGGYFVWEIQNTNDNGFILAAGTADNRAIKLNQNGDLEWVYEYSVGYPRYIEQFDDGNFYVPSSNMIYILNENGQEIYHNDNPNLFGDIFDGKIVNPNSFLGLYNDYSTTSRLIYSSIDDQNIWLRDYEAVLRGIDLSINGELFLTGFINSFPDTTPDTAYFIKTDSDGINIWDKKYVLGFDDYKQEMYDGIFTSDSSFISIGVCYVDGTAETGADLVVIKLDENGDSLWTKRYGGQYHDYSETVIETFNGNYLIAGYTTQDYSQGDTDAWLLLLDSNGDSLWSNTYAETIGQGIDKAYSVVQAGDGSFVFCGIYDYSPFVAKTEYAESISELPPVLADIDNQQIEEDGSVTLEINATSYTGLDMTFAATSDTSDVVIFLDNTTLTVTPETDWYGTANVTVMVTDEDGLSDTTEFTLTVTPVNDAPQDFDLVFPVITDTIQINTDTDETIQFYWEESIDIDSDVSYLTTITLNYFGNVYTLEYESDTSTVSIPGYDWAELMTAQNIDIRTFQYSVKASDEEFEILSEGEFVFQNTSLSIDENISPLVFSLQQNYPNPFNPITTLKYDLPEDSFVSIIVYDMLGNVVNKLVNKNQNSGYKSIQWNATNNSGQPVSAGVYLYTIEAGDFRQTKKMVLLK